MITLEDGRRISLEYNEARSLIKSGDIIAFTHDGWSSLSDIESQIVRIFTRSEYSHVGIAWVVGGRVMIIDAVVPAIRIFTLSKLTPFYWISMPDSWTPEVEELALSRVGEPYSRLEAIRGFFSKTKQDGKWQCAEFVRSTLGLPGRDTPSDVVFNAIISHHGIIQAVTK